MDLRKAMDLELMIIRCLKKSIIINKIFTINWSQSLSPYTNYITPNQLDSSGLLNININIGFDTTAQADAGTLKNIAKEKQKLQDNVDACCKTYQVACGDIVKFHFDYNQKNAPAGGYTNAPGGTSLDPNAGGISGVAGGINVLVTGSPINYGGSDEGETTGAGNIGLNTGGLGLSGNLLSHELGHRGGYKGGNIDNKTHTNDPSKIMVGGTFAIGGTPGSGIDLCWCNAIASLAK
jgi:hypothetical protein